MAAGTTATATTNPWSVRLREHCLVRGLGLPTWQDVSDRRGGRTAWSSIINIQGTHYAARYWYDGAYVEQAREDAAEMALRKITGFVDLSVDVPPAGWWVGGRG
ncbi:hypothetical protein DM02DRAFT_664451 [Periconia macrospinosa]|uniref:DRBM domain-containing protein n=1 Tax=Periconia macrospinosa TaxID=97972 RepID=A0A2V1CZ12_9PLEO|nr:hypothetical protein DM02DRAFT_664451 [Periconia macrospinosa]